VEEFLKYCQVNMPTTMTIEYIRMTWPMLLLFYSSKVNNFVCQGKANKMEIEEEGNSKLEVY